MIPRDIIAGFGRALEAETQPPEDAGHPPTYKRVGSFVDIEDGEDLSFVVKLASDNAIELLQSTGIEGQGDFRMNVEVVLKTLNEGRDDSDFEGLLAEHQRRVQDRVAGYFNANNVDGVDGCIDRGVSVDRDWEARCAYSTFRWEVVYHDAMATS